MDFSNINNISSLVNMSAKGASSLLENLLTLINDIDNRYLNEKEDPYLKDSLSKIRASLVSIHSGLIDKEYNRVKGALNNIHSNLDLISNLPIFGRIAIITSRIDRLVEMK